MSYANHAKREFKALGYTPLDEEQEDGPNKWIQEYVLELLEVFANQNHSGFSAPICIDYFSKMALFKPVAPLTGEDHEWEEIGDGLYQNNRCYRVFKNENENDGQAYDIDGIVFVDKDGTSFTSKASRVFITFPYTPETKYVEL